MLTTDQRIQMQIGVLIIQNTAQQVELEQIPALKAEIETLKAQLAEKAPDAPVKEPEPT